MPAIVFIAVSGLLVRDAVQHPWAVGAHALIYTDAARAALAGADPWTVGPRGGVFAGPPPMLLPFVPFIPVPRDAVRALWVVGTAVLALLSLRRLGLPAWWIAFPPLSSSVILGHPEPLVLWLLLQRSPVSALAPVLKPYAVFPLIASERWAVIALSALIAVASAAVLPWSLFFHHLSDIAQTLAAQSRGDSVADNPILMLVAVGALLILGWRRALWLATPLLWPNAQPNYKVASIPALSPMLATFWAIPIPGMTLLGLGIEAACIAVASRHRLPAWLAAGLVRPAQAVALIDQPRAAAGQPIPSTGH